MAPHPELTSGEQALSPMAVHDLQVSKSFVKRADGAYVQLAAAGARPPHDLSGPGFQVLFALIGVGLCFGAIWFFFWAKNGGFKWRKDDWEDYKSTVLRRKGPDGKTLSNATKSTRLGGGSVVHGGSYGAPSTLGFTDETGTQADGNEYRDAEEGNGGLRGGDGRREKKHRRDHTNDYKDPELRNYRHEKAARVGGLNGLADGIYTDYSGSQPASELGSHVSSNAPLVKKSKEVRDPKKEAKAKEQRAKERFRKAKLAEKEAAKKAAADAKARKEAEKAEIKRTKAEQKKMKKARSEAAPSEGSPEMAEVTQPLTEYTHAYTEYTAPSEAGYTEYTGYTEESRAIAPIPKPASDIRRSTTKGPAGPRRAPPSAAYSFTTGDDTNTVYSDNARTEARTAPSEMNESSYYSDYRPNADPSVYTSRTSKDKTRSRSARPSQDRERRQSARASRESASQPRPSRELVTASARPRPSSSRPTSQSPRKQQRPEAPPSDIFTAANGEAKGNMSYPCYIPGLSQAGSVGVGESVSQVGAPSSARRGGRDVMDGYRRGGVRTVGRRDSLSDSD
ncbi:hypothetical protein IAQ61_004899 [Plenodomus lingam]|uniref:Endosomal SPRY domain protein n=1 Tax=Leptosphaeria maculans (strain JN3 / isolate v23.1.3 / race Av1-4-5-6-7-8) TaxID=985895 RepID=E4ZWU6_LEPMJ|nr:hypothetical protein LEMA_P032240.1 [Plenodomus lingam JN3]KAH9874269.1 hypothetical protein IAQ61_004899 [Plenodomus lingam]CBX96072.1 hypothetical protein LEMA_P032240.1 [Plenodomus lingam JN3]